MAYSLPSVESMLKALNYSNKDRSETGRSMWNCLVVIN